MNTKTEPVLPASRAREKASWMGWGTAVSRYGVLVALVLVIVGFSLLKPDTFPTIANAKSILQQMAPLAIVAFGLTVILAMGDFDLSIAGVVGLAGAVDIVLMSSLDLNFVVAILLALGVGVVAGLVNGTLVAYAGASSFIITLATGQVMLGLETQLTGGNNVYENVSQTFQQITSGRFLGLSNEIYIAIAVGIIVYLLLEHSVVGRYMYAIGENREAARLSGIPVKPLRVAGFVIVAVCAATAGILVVSSAAAYVPNSGTPFFLPSYAAVFLGAAVLAPGKFNLLGTLIGVLLLEVVATGLTMLQISTAVVLLVQGVILGVAVLLSRLGGAR